MALILIVDDQPEVCRPLSMLLKHVGHQGVCVESGEKALNYVRDQRPALVILDVMMPGMDGMEVLRQLRSDPQTETLPVVMFSAVSDPAFRKHAKEKGANDYWVKAAMPFDAIRTSVEALLAPAPPDNPSAPTH